MRVSRGDDSATPRPVLAGDALDVVLAHRRPRPVAVLRPLACVAPHASQRPGPLRALSVLALGHAPGTAVVVRLSVPFAAALDLRCLDEALGAVRVPREAAGALERALRIVCIDRARGGLARAGPGDAHAGGLVHDAGLAALGAVAGPLAETLGPAPVQCLRPGLAADEAASEWAARLRAGGACAQRRCVLMRGGTLGIALDAATGRLRLERHHPGGRRDAPAEVTLATPLPRGASLRARLPCAEDHLVVDTTVLASLVEALAPGADIARRIDAVALGAVARPFVWPTRPRRRTPR